MPDEKCEQNRSLQQNGSLVCLVSTEFLSLYHKERLPTVGIKRQALPKKRSPLSAILVMPHLFW